MKRYNQLYIISLFLLFTFKGITQTISTEEAWDQTLKQSAFVKLGIERLNNRYYQYESLGLGGTTMLVSPYGFTSSGAPGIGATYYLEHLPYLGYQYWWDEEAHRHLPFKLKGGYGQNVDEGGIISFDHHLDIKTGLLTINLTLDVGGKAITSKREMFISPEGVLVIKVTDSGSADPLQIRVDINKNVRIYNNIGIYNKSHAPWNGVALSKSNCMVIKGERPRSCVATLAIALDASDINIKTENFLIGTSQVGGSLIYYIAPGSSYESKDPVKTAWQKAVLARNKGYNTMLEETTDWWKNYYSKSAIRIPDANLSKEYAQSLYYHGVYFGNTDIPPGCNATSIEGFAGAVCPEYDLVFSQLALLYTGHFNESKRVVDWLYKVLPRTERYATEGLTHHKVFIRYSDGAKYTTLMGYDGTVLIQPTVAEGANAYSIYPGANAAFMSFSYVDFSADSHYDSKANVILKKTTQVSLEQLSWNIRNNKYIDRYSPSTVQQSATMMGLRECFERGIADTSWEKYRDKILLPKGSLNGSIVISGGAGNLPAKSAGDATWLSPLWWHGNISKNDPLIRPSYKMNSITKTGDYVFNNGWMGVIAAKLLDGEEANRWVNQFFTKDVRFFDETCFGEAVSGIEDYKKTPEIGAHGAFICNITQMLLDPDDKDNIAIFPAIPAGWEKKGVSFVNLIAKGNIAVSGEFDKDKVCIAIENRSDKVQIRTLRIRLKKGNPTLSSAPEGTKVEGDFAKISITLQSNEKRKFEFVYASTSSGLKKLNNKYFENKTEKISAIDSGSDYNN